jgi:thiol:disulfide interchange protein DsbD
MHHTLRLLTADWPRLFCLVLGILLAISGAHASGGRNLLQTVDDEFGAATAIEPEFLKVDDAFILGSEITPEGLRLNWTIAKGYYLYLERFKFRSDVAGVTLGQPRYSNTGELEHDPYFGDVHTIYDALEVILPVTLPAGVLEAEIGISYQGCAKAGLCYPPRSQTVLFVGSAMASGSDGSEATAPEIEPDHGLDTSDGISRFLENSSLPLIVGIFFLLGLGLTFTPCVFPMIPIMTSIIAGQQKPTPLRSFVLALTYVLGMALTYALAGVITGLLGAGANIQAMMQDPVILSVFAAIFVLLALAMFGFYELQLPGFIRDRLNSTSQSISGGQLTGVFFIGALSALVVSPCVSAPLAGALLYISATGDALIGGLSLFALGLGMGVPLILIAVGGGALLPKAGRWMDVVKAVFGVMLLAVAIYLLGRFVPPSLSMLLWALLLILVGNAMGAFDAARPGWPRLCKGLGQIAAGWGFLMLVGVLSGGSDPLRPLATLGAGDIDRSDAAMASLPNRVAFRTIHDRPGLERELALARAAGKPLLLDFYADWCASCITMEKQVFPRPDIAPLLQRFHLVKADVTANDARNQSLLSEFGLFGPPSMIFYDPQATEIKRLRVVGEISAETFRERLEGALTGR